MKTLTFFFGLSLFATACGGGGGGGSAPVVTALEVSPPANFMASGPEGGPFASDVTYTVDNSGGNDISWSVASDVPWIALSKSAGVLSAGGQDSVTVSIEPTTATNLPAGRHEGTISFTDNGNGQQAFTTTAVLLVITALDVSPSADFVASGPEGGPFTSDVTYTLDNPGGKDISWSAASDVPWIALSKSIGVLASGSQDQVIASIESTTASNLPVGRHEGNISFTDTGSGQDAFTTTAVLLVDFGARIENNSWLSVNGAPFFPIGIWNQRPIESAVTYAKSLGVNTFLRNGQTPLDNDKLLDLLEANDMWGILEFDPTVVDHPRLLLWLLPDEPDLKITPPPIVKMEYDAIKAADPIHLVALNLSAHFYWDDNIVLGGPLGESDYQAYTDIPDIASFDMYPVTGWNRPMWVYAPGAMTEFMLDRYVDRLKPVWAIIEASDQNLPFTPPTTPGPTPEQMRFEAWDAIIHGATAIHYFVSSFQPFTFRNLTPEIEQEMVRTNGQIQDLSHIILRGPPGLNFTSSEIAGLDHNFMARMDGSVLYLFVDNADMGYNPATISFTFGQDITSVTVYDEGRMITPNGKSFTDNFAPLEVHIYEVRF